MLKFRTMRRLHHCHNTALITSHSDPRVFFFGNILRFLKLDELPQLFNILLGDMTFIGPRPEDPHIVDSYYLSDLHFATLSVLPGLASPGSIFNYTNCSPFLSVNKTLESYVTIVLPAKLSLDFEYIQRRSFFYDIRLCLRVLRVLILKSLGFKFSRVPFEYHYIPDSSPFKYLFTQVFSLLR